MHGTPALMNLFFTIRVNCLVSAHPSTDNPKNGILLVLVQNRFDSSPVHSNDIILILYGEFIPKIQRPHKYRMRKYPIGRERSRLHSLPVCKVIRLISILFLNTLRLHLTLF
jgi:hypothetical protein